MTNDRNLQTGDTAALPANLKPYRAANGPRALWQLVATVVPFFLLWYLAYRSLGASYLLTLVLAVPTGAFLLRIFILQHDLGHGSFFRSRRANDVLGSLFGVLTLIPYYYWRRFHNLHHADSGNLDRRGPGDVTTLTVREYLARPWWRRLSYRLHRNPFIVFSIGGVFHFLVQHRIPYDAPRAWKTERRSVYFTNLAILMVGLILSWAIGFRVLVLVHLPVLFVASTGAVWLFLNQHSFEEAYWEPERRWSFVESGLRGSSYYKLPRMLEWLTASVGLHHVHHLNPSIPSYNLSRCLREIDELRRVRPLTIKKSLNMPFLALWDEDRRRLIRFGDLVSPLASPDSQPKPKVQR